MLVELLNRLFGSEIQGNRGERKNEMAVKIEKQQQETAVNVKPQYDDPDLNILAEKYGELESGKVIVIELGEAAKLLGRKRVRLDAFTSLQKKLKNDYGVELQIYSRRTKLKKEE